ncbi:dnaJ homolog subfamily C member 13 isoform X1 [Neodiprion virginianus]|uniref:dnaJ homolog subfamily C member 13 isoform X1 n=2 Tax=Neodiprion virginianus TaxID=2961670 RepID=UPI001EE6E934|nr:dnaJ homolog subfamily C member 13 isoform X1 [Neodiprion virginianus]
MMPIKDNQDVACFLVTKHSWKGKYKRVFSIGSMGITTYNPGNLEVTNKWAYSDFISLQPTNKSQTGLYEFSITMRKERKVDTMRFSSEYRLQLLTEALKFRNQFAEKPKEILRYQAYKHHWSDTRLPVVLEVTPFSLDQLDPATNMLLASYCYKDFEGLATMKDYPGGFVIVCGGFGRLHLFASHQIEEIKKKMLESALNNLGINIKVLKEQIILDDFLTQRLGKFSGDEHITSVSEFTVHKLSSRHPDPQRRTLCLSDTCLVERDPQTYSICTLRPLSDIFTLVRDNSNPQLFTIQYLNGQMRSYTTTDRDSLLASLLDGVRASGNRDVHVKMYPISRGKRLGPLNLPVDEEVETSHVKFLQQPPGNKSFSEMLERFNANAPYNGLHYSTSQDDNKPLDWTVTTLQLQVHRVTNDYLQGLFTENKDKVILGALNALVSKELETNSEVEAQFHALRRLVASKVGFTAFTTLPGFREAIGNKVVKALKRQDCGVTQAAMDCICALMQPMHEDCDLRQEQLNKSSLLSSTKFLDSLLDMWISHVNHGTGALVVSAMLDFLTFALCVPYSETTDGKHFDNLLEMVAARGRSLFRLFQHPSLAVVKGAGLVMRAIIEEGAPEIAAKMQELALAEGALPRHLLNSLFTLGSDGRLLTHRQLCRHLVGLWVTGHPTAMGLLKRIMPVGLLNYLDSEEKVPDSFLEEERLNNRDNLKIAIDHASKNRKSPQWIAIERQMRVLERHVENALQHWGARVGIERREKIKERPIVLRKRRERIKSEANWKLFYYKFNQDHALPNLIWNHKTREELRTALENEIRAFSSDKDLSGGTLIAWNHREFEVQYHSLSDEVKIGDYYLRLLLEKEDSPDSPIRKSYEFFNDLYHRFLLTTKIEMKCLCLQAMTIVYGRYFEDIGPFSDTKYIVGMLERCSDRMERDRLVMFINKLILHRRNVKDIMDQNGVRTLVDLLTLAHLHTSRAVVPTQTNVIEAGPDQERVMEKEWYYNDGDQRKGPICITELKKLYAAGKINNKTKVWAQGLDGWRMVMQVPQLKWTLVAKGSPVINESELATLVLNILIKMCEYFPSRDADDAIIRPLPRVKRLLSDPQCMPHVVQLLLTFDPVLVERVSTLLCEVMKDNPDVSKIYLTGIFFFILMYTGSNVLPVARFLQLTHTKQAFRGDENTASDIMQRSILGQLLPDAMVSYLENHGAEKFAQIFLGDFDTPEAIWNAEMRRMLIEKVAAHIADFSPRLRSHTLARYQYIPIPAIRYPQLENELFCQIFYLRHLCDTNKFPQWPIPDPVRLLKDVLDAWKKEVEKKPPVMTVDDAYRVLGLAGGKQHNEATVRKSYYKLAQMYHPDKNPDGRDKFEAVNQAYEFLCSRSCWTADGPNPDNIVLILRTQSILFHRYADELQPYKYAGYPQLIKTIKFETNDDQLFSKSAPLLAAASELAYHTVHCSALNAEELRREGGLEVMLEAYSRCVSVLNNSSKPNDVAVQVCTHITRCFAVAGLFRGCREKMVELPQLVRDLCRLLYFKHLTKLCSVATECVSSLATDSVLQMQLLQSGALWHLLLFMFNYDYTLEEGGVKRSQDENRQEVANNLAKLAVRACARLGGYMTGDNETPVNPVTVAALESTLTLYLARQLGKEKPEEILKILNSNCSNPYLIWDNGTRAELNEYLESKRQERLSGNGDFEHDFTEFKYTAHSNELIIGEIFVKIYNEQPTFPIENPKGFTIDLLDFLSKSAAYLASVGSVALLKKDQEKLRHIVISLDALKNVIKNNPGVEMQCIGHFKLLFGLLSCNSFKPIQKGALEVINNVTKNQECVNDIAANEVVVHLLLCLHSLTECQLLTLETLYALMSTTKIVKDALTKGAVVYILDLFCNSNNTQIREAAADLLAKMSSDKLAGPKVKLDLSKFLPRLFSEAIRDAPKQCVHMFESRHENPELIWDDDSKNRVSRIVSEMKEEHYAAQRVNPNTNLKLPEMQTNIDIGSNEPVVAGVYLRLFIASPTWALRKPKEFLSELMDTTLILMSKEKTDTDLLELAAQALVCLLQAQPALADQVPSLGHIPKLCRQMSVPNSQPAVYKAAILILHQLAASEICITSICQTECISPLKYAMQSRKDMIAIACEALNRLFSTNEDRLVKQALEAQMVPYLLTLLEGRLDTIDNPGTTKAQIVKALKAMTRSLLLGEKITAILDKSSVWAEYKDQMHDLFISNTPTAGYLTAGVPVSAGYLTAGPSATLPTGPPPVDKEDNVINRNDNI